MESYEIRAAFLNDLVSASVGHGLIDPEYPVIIEEAIHSMIYFKRPASLTKHHCYRGGLLAHSIEVAQTAKQFCGRSWGTRPRKLLGIAAFWHDITKAFEYKYNADEGCFENTPYRDHIGHVAGSVIEVAKDLNYRKTVFIDPKDRDELFHILLSHHGRKDWGAVVEPQTELAHIFHWADMYSSRYGRTKDLPDIWQALFRLFPDTSLDWEGMYGSVFSEPPID